MNYRPWTEKEPKGTAEVSPSHFGAGLTAPTNARWRLATRAVGGSRGLWVWSSRKRAPHRYQSLSSLTPRRSSRAVRWTNWASYRRQLTPTTPRTTPSTRHGLSGSNGEESFSAPHKQGLIQNFLFSLARPKEQVQVTFSPTFARSVS